MTCLDCLIVLRTRLQNSPAIISLQPSALGPAPGPRYREPLLSQHCSFRFLGRAAPKGVNAGASSECVLGQGGGRNEPLPYSVSGRTGGDEGLLVLKPRRRNPENWLACSGSLCHRPALPLRGERTPPLSRGLGCHWCRGTWRAVLIPQGTAHLILLSRR